MISPQIQATLIRAERTMQVERNLHGHNAINHNYTDDRFGQREPCFGLRRKTVGREEQQVRLMGLVRIFNWAISLSDWFG